MKTKIKKTNVSKTDKIIAADRENRIRELDSTLNKIQLLRGYVHHDYLGGGVGFLLEPMNGIDAGELVEFRFEPAGFVVEKITVTDAARWMYEMQLAELRMSMDLAMRDPDAEIRWLKMVAQLSQ